MQSKSPQGNPQTIARHQQLLIQAQNHQRAGQGGDAEKLYLQILADVPAHTDANHGLALLYHQHGHSEKAIPLLHNIISATPNNAMIRFMLGAIYLQMGEQISALEHLNACLELNPANNDARQHLGKTLVDLGRVEEAKKVWREVLEKQADCAQAYFYLSQLEKYRERNEETAAMEMLWREELSDKNRIFLAFALGNVLEAVGDHEKSFEYLLEGNTLKRKTFNYDINAWVDLTACIKKTFTQDYFQRHQQREQQASLDNEGPIFVLGMPRSGTSLVEQILASHSSVFGAGELKTMPALCKQLLTTQKKQFPDYFSDLSTQDMESLGNAYLQQTRALAEQESYVTDKLPHNFRYIGIIAAALPNAKIIHCQRDPMDTCFSVFTSYFGDANPYSYSLDELARFYKLYEETMDHWEQVLAGKIYTVRYEELVANPEANIRSLLDYCGLGFEQECLSFHKTERVVDTASAAQVRKPIYKGSVQRWKKYEVQLSSLKQALNYL